MQTLIYGGTIVNDGRMFRGSLVVEDQQIALVMEGEDKPRGLYDNEIDATGCFVLPGVIDTHVHFRSPGLTHKATIDSESRAAAYGGVTSVLDMPNTLPQTTSPDALADKQTLFGRECHVNYGIFYGATTQNAASFASINRATIPGIKLFMGSSTGGMLVDKSDALHEVFAECARLGLPVMAHCEDTDIINRNMAAAIERYGDDPDVTHHAEIRSEEACFVSSERAVELAKAHKTRLHIAHLTTARELQLLDTGGDRFITGEACPAHLLFTDADYATLGTRIKCNPAVKTSADRDALRHALADGTITTIGTDHAPHEPEAKQGGARKAASGMPMVQFSLVSMLSTMVDCGVVTLPRLVELMSHAPAKLFGIVGRGFLREGYQADIAIVRPHSEWTLTKEDIQSKCGWSPLEGRRFGWSVQQTLCNGLLIYNKGEFDSASLGQPLTFNHPQ